MVQDESENTGVGQRALRNLRTVSVWHPALFMLVPVLGLYGQNTGVVPPSALIKPVVYSIGSAISAWAVLWALLRNRYRAGVFVSAMVIPLVVLWGVFEDAIRIAIPLLQTWPPFVLYVAAIAVVTVVQFLLIGRTSWATKANRPRLFLILGVCAVGFFLVAVGLSSMYGRRAAWMITAYVFMIAYALIWLWRYDGDSLALTRTLNWFAGILVGLYGVVILYNRVPETGPTPQPLAASTQATTPEDESPDIYLVFLDGYARSDVLQRIYGINNRAFEDSMHALGFEIASNGTTNYANQMLATTACLNLDYLEALAQEQGELTMSDVHALYQDNRAFEYVRDRGYETIMYSPGLEWLEPREGMADHVLEPPGALGEFDTVLLERTFMGRVLQAAYYFWYDNPAYWRYEFRHERVLFALEGMKALARTDSAKPRFVVAHLLVPEPPFLFTREGDRAQPFGEGSLAIDKTFRGLEAEFRTAYSGQIQFINGQLRSLASEIIGSPRPSAVIIVSTRGAPALFRRTATPQPERLASLIMTRFPLDAHSGGETVYDSISLVNVLRVAFNRVFKTALPRVDDRPGAVNNLDSNQTQ